MSAMPTLVLSRAAKASRATLVVLLLSLESTLRSSKARAAGTARSTVVRGTTMRSAGALLVTLMVAVALVVLVLVMLIVLVVVVAEETHD
jgi:hypothetical protein